MEQSQNTNLRDKIEEAIATGFYKPSEHLDEASLALNFSVSRTPVREALQQLAAVGLVEIRKHKGAIVSAPSPARLVEMFEVMAELEAACGRLAAKRIQIDGEKHLKETLENCKRAAEKGDTDAYYYENEQFHRAIYAASRNSFLAEQALILHKRLAPYRRLQLRVRNRMRASQSEHEQIVAEILIGNSESAGTKLYNHIAIQGERFADLLASIKV